jgi:hypothetical protein
MDQGCDGLCRTCCNLMNALTEQCRDTPAFECRQSAPFGFTCDYELKYQAGYSGPTNQWQLPGGRITKSQS